MIKPIGNAYIGKKHYITSGIKPSETYFKKKENIYNSNNQTASSIRSNIGGMQYLSNANISFKRNPHGKLQVWSSDNDRIVMHTYSSIIFKHPTKISNKFLEENKGKIISGYEEYTYPDSMYGFPCIDRYDLKVYIDENANISIYTLDDDMGDIFINKLLDEGKEEEAFDLIGKIYAKEIPNANITKKEKQDLSKNLIMQGRYDEAIELFPDYREYIEDIYKDLYEKYNDYKENEQKTSEDELAEGKFIEANEILGKYTEDRANEIDGYIKDNDLFKKWADAHLARMLRKARGRYDGEDDGTRTMRLILTLGISEIINKISREDNKYKLSESAKETIEEERKVVQGVINKMLEARNNKANKKENRSFFLYNIEHKRENAKRIIQQRFISPLKACSKENPIRLPNCIMLYGENPFVMDEIINWAAEHVKISGANYIKLDSSPDKDEMIQNLYEALQDAEEKYQDTGKNSLIYVSGMGKLLEKDANSNSTIAIMKNYMDKANKYFHSTLIFHTTKDPENFDPGTTASHRMDLKINVPIELDEVEVRE